MDQNPYEVFRAELADPPPLPKPGRHQQAGSILRWMFFWQAVVIVLLVVVIAAGAAGHWEILLALLILAGLALRAGWKILAVFCG